MDHSEILKLEDQMIESRYGYDGVDGDTTRHLIAEVIRCHNEIATLKGEEIPFPDNRSRKPEKKAVGFNAEHA